MYMFNIFLSQDLLYFAGTDWERERMYCCMMLFTIKKKKSKMTKPQDLKYHTCHTLTE